MKKEFQTQYYNNNEFSEKLKLKNKYYYNAYSVGIHELKSRWYWLKNMDNIQNNIQTLYACDIY